jgi:hypothetical protein
MNLEFDKEKVLRDNRQIDPALVEGFEKLIEQLARMGVSMPSSPYSLTPPLGAGVYTVAFQNRVAE